MRLIPALLLLAGCSSGSNAVQLCDGAIKAKIKTPATYSKINSTDESKSPFKYVVIEFDAQSGFGAVIRSKGYCKFDTTGIYDVVIK